MIVWRHERRDHKFMALSIGRIGSESTQAPSLSIGDRRLSRFRSSATPPTCVRACGFLTESGFPNRLSSDSRCASGGLAMTRPYSEDLRERAVARFEAGETIRSIGKAFGIDPSCVPKWVKRRRETGSVAPAAIGGRKPSTLSGDVAVWLRDRLHSGRFTTRGLAAELAARGIKTDRRAVWTFVREEGLSFKKKPVRQRAGSARRRAQT